MRNEEIMKGQERSSESQECLRSKNSVDDQIELKYGVVVVKIQYCSMVVLTKHTRLYEHTSRTAKPSSPKSQW